MLPRNQKQAQTRFPYQPEVSDMSCNCECRPSCPYSEWLHPLCCNPAHFCCAGWENGRRSSFIKSCLNPAATRAARSARSPCASPAPVIPMGRFSSLRAGSCTQLGRAGSSSAGLTRAVMPSKNCSTVRTNTARPSPARSMGNVVQLTNSCVPTVVTIVNRKRLCRRRYCGG